MQRRSRIGIAGVPLIVACLLGAAPPTGAAPAPAAAVAGVKAPAGYRLLSPDGGVFSFGLPFAGAPASQWPACMPNESDRAMPHGACWSMATTPSGRGYWVLNASSGVVYEYGDAAFYGDPAQHLTGVPREFFPDFVGIVPTPSGRGYWVLVAGLNGLGSVEAFGDAGFHGDERTIAHDAGHAGSPVAIVPTASGKGYWIVDSDGGVFSFGDARFLGSMGGRRLAGPVVAAARTDDGRGYWLTAADGGVFAFGDARFAGSLAGSAGHGRVVGIAANPAGDGYWLAESGGEVDALGGAPFLGSEFGRPLNEPVFAVSAPLARS